MRGKTTGPASPGRLAHHGLFHRLHPQGQGGEGVGHQIQPQQLHRAEGAWGNENTVARKMVKISPMLQESK